MSIGLLGISQYLGFGYGLKKIVIYIFIQAFFIIQILAP